MAHSQGNIAGMTRTLQSLLIAAGLPCPAGAENITVTGITDDSRLVQPGSLFVAYQGVEADGHKYIPNAIARGAAVILFENEWRIENEELRKSIFAILNSSFSISVANGRRAFALLSAAWHDFPSRSMTMIGVTGTDGKTTTSNLIYQILKAAGVKAGMISTVNAVIGDAAMDTGLHVTTPDADELQGYLAQMRDAGMTHCVLEVTSHGLAHYRVDGTQFDVAVITNITHEHLDLHGSRENYRAAKARLFEMAKAHVLNVDDDFSFSHLVKLPAEQRIFYSREIQPNGNYSDTWLFPPRVDHAAGAIDAYAFKANGERLHLPLKMQLIGDYNVSNVLAAAGAALAIGISVEAIQAGIAALEGIPGRMQRIDLGQPYLAVVDFAHTPNALENCLIALRRITPGRLICAFGCAGERDREKRYLMGKAAAALADVAIFTAEDPRREDINDIFAEMQRGADDAQPKLAEIIKIADRGAALQHACAMAVAGDIVVACGKGHEQSLCYGKTEYAWDDREAMRVAIHGAAMPLGKAVA
jgi:UDP-N-acetylmuramoyl-L-alanyl-D-glutamate--2,6-diaminopimelate ligase